MMPTDDKKKKMQIPFVDLKLIHDSIRIEFMELFNEILDCSGFIGGKHHDNFEKEFAAYCNVKYCAGVANGTDALSLALRSLGVGKGDEVIIPSHTFIATAEAVSIAEAKPVFVDIDPRTYCMDPAALEAAITSKTKVLIPVHLYGHPAEMEDIQAIAQKHGLKIVEDACQAHGAEYKGKKVGVFGDLACFSFYPGKNLGALGDAGAVASDNEEFINAIKLMSNHGRDGKYSHKVIGINSRLDGLQAAFLRIKLKKLDHWNVERIKAAAAYRKLLGDIDELVLPHCDQKVKHVYHLYVVLADYRDDLQNYLQKRGVATGVHYPKPIHLQEAYDHLKVPKGELPHTEKVSADCLSLPMYPGMEEENIKYIADEIKSFYARAK